MKLTTKSHAKKHLINLSISFCQLKNKGDLARILGVTPELLEQVATKPDYKNFKIPKRDGTERTIEDAQGTLKGLQKKLNTYLQAVYYHHRTKAAYGFVTNAKSDRVPRNYISNAQQHYGKPYLLNIDLKDFFHHVTTEQVERLFQHHPFHFDEKLAQLIVKLVCYNGRLPMGTHTSPAISNFAARQLDLDLLTLAERFEWKYTRYADDMSFSSETAITNAHYKILNTTIQKRGFLINPKKVKWYEPDDVKIVTGIVVKADSLDLTEGYIEDVQADIDKLAQILEVQNLAGSVRTGWVDKYKKLIQGKLIYIQSVLGKDEKRFINLQTNFKQAQQPPIEDFGTLSWRFFDYNN